MRGKSMTGWYKIFVVISLCGPIIDAVSSYIYTCICMIIYNAGCWSAGNKKLKLIRAETHKMHHKFYVFLKN
jgi:hypothetical protein